MGSRWLLEGFIGASGVAERLPLPTLPCRVGRDPALALALQGHAISRQHAEFFERDGALWLRDLSSTNGSYVNRERLQGERRLVHGDIIHFASLELRLLSSDNGQEDTGDTPTEFSAAPLSRRLVAGLADLEMLLQTPCLTAHFQPIVDGEGRLRAYEMLARGTHSALTPSPGGLFEIAESVPGKAAQLSSLMRQQAVAVAAAAAVEQPVFINTHPEEMETPERVLADLARLREACPAVRLVLEIHENVVTDISALREFAVALGALDVDLAYDDFGAGQARLQEMVEVPVRYIKFDRALIRAIHQAPPQRWRLLETLVTLTRDLGATTLAEGVELAEESEACRTLGFELQQGYYFARPAPLPDYRNPRTSGPQARR